MESKNIESNPIQGGRNHAAEQMYARGLGLEQAGKTDEAIGCFLKVITMAPQFAGAHFKLGHCLLRKGEYRAGWMEFEWRLRMKDPVFQLPKFRAPPWSGMRRKQGSIMLIGDQGYGDTLQFTRYIPMVAERCGSVSLGCSEPLLPL